jgi:hypothetical protein
MQKYHLCVKGACEIVHIILSQVRTTSLPQMYLTRAVIWHPLYAFRLDFWFKSFVCLVQPCFDNYERVNIRGCDLALFNHSAHDHSVSLDIED